MGSYMEHCAVTSVPVDYDDNVMVFIVEQNTCDHAKVVSLPIYGKYNDYGSVELDEMRKYFKKF